MTPENERDNAAEEGARDDARPEDGATDATDGADTAAGDGGAETLDSANGAGAGGAGEPLDGEVVAESDAADVEGDGPDDGEPSVEERLAIAEALAKTNFERVQRMQAEMENQRKRAQRDVANARKFALDGIAGDLLPVKDSLELGIRAASADEASLSSLLEGSELTLKMLAQVLEKNAIVEIDPDGEKFDPEFHQAMSMQEVEGVAPNIVTGVMQKGYTLNERLLRPALVMVSK